MEQRRYHNSSMLSVPVQVVLKWLQLLLICWYEKLSIPVRSDILNQYKEILKAINTVILCEICSKGTEQRTVPVEMLLEASSSAIRPSRVEAQVSVIS